MSDDSRVRIYRNAIPSHAVADMERLYESVFSTVPFVDVYGHGATLHTYVARRRDHVTAALLFEIRGKRVAVRNEGLAIDAPEIECFCEHIFGSYPFVDMVSFNAIRTAPLRLSRPLQRFGCLEDIVVPLPDTPEQYTSALGRATRRNLRRYMNRLRRDHPGMRHEVFVGDAIPEEHIRTIFHFNRQRMAHKGKLSSLDDAEAERTIRLARLCGLASVITIDGRVCAGEICMRTGTHFFSHVGAHDPAWDEYRLGNLSCYLCIAECIRRGGREFHFLWGEYAYKYQLAGQRRELDHLTVYRSRGHLWLNGGIALRNLARGAWRRLRSAMAAHLPPGSARTEPAALAPWQANRLPGW